MEISPEHKAEKDEVAGESYNWLPDFIYGGIDGTITTFAVVAGVEGANLSVSTILILGFANLLADGFSMATGKYLSDKAEIEQYQKIKAMERTHLTKYREEEIAEVREILEKYKFKGEQLEKATQTIISNDENWLEFMMKHEFTLTADANPVRGGLSTFISFLLVGFIPLAAYTFQPLLKLDNEQTFIVTSIATLFGLFIIGTVKSKFTARNWFISGLEIAGLGGLAAIIAYAVGAMLETIV